MIVRIAYVARSAILELNCEVGVRVQAQPPEGQRIFPLPESAEEKV